MNRICPSEETLSEYLYGALDGDRRDEIEEHLASCAGCRRLVAEAHDVVRTPAAVKAARKALSFVRGKAWLALSAAAFILSFIYPRHFLQFLTACLLMGAKWIMDSRTARILVMIQEAWKSGDKEKADDLFSRFTFHK